MQNLLITEVAALMVLHVASRAETFVAAFLGTGEGALVAMDALMDFEVLLLAKGSVAGRLGASEWLSAVVHVQMGSQAGLSGETLLAATVGADELSALAQALKVALTAFIGLSLGLGFVRGG